MNIRICAGKVAQGLGGAAVDGLEDEPIMRSIVDLRGRHSEAQFKRHIEARRTRWGSVQFDSRQIMNRIAAGTNQLQNLFEAIATPRDFERGAGIEPKMDQAGDIGKVEAAKSIVVRDVEEDRILGKFRRPCAHGFLSSSSKAGSQMPPHLSHAWQPRKVR